MMEKTIQRRRGVVSSSRRNMYCDAGRHGPGAIKVSDRFLKLNLKEWEDPFSFCYFICRIDRFLCVCVCLYVVLIVKSG